MKNWKHQHSQHQFQLISSNKNTFFKCIFFSQHQKSSQLLQFDKKISNKKYKFIQGKKIQNFNKKIKISKIYSYLHKTFSH